MCNNHSKVFSSIAIARGAALRCTAGTLSKPFPGGMTLNPCVGAKRPGLVLGPCPRGGVARGEPARPGPAAGGDRRPSRPGCPAPPPGQAALLAPAALGLVSPALSGRGVFFPRFRLKGGCLSRSSSEESGGAERPGRASPSGATHPAASGREGTGSRPDGAQRAAGRGSGGVLPMSAKLPTVCCKCGRSGVLTTILLRGRAARRRGCEEVLRPPVGPAAG